jgi:holin-like protein
MQAALFELRLECIQSIRFVHAALRHILCLYIVFEALVMPHRSISHQFRRLLRRSPLAQLALVAAFWLAGETAVRLTGLPLPGSIIGMALALLALSVRGLHIGSMKRGANWLLAEMLLFFVPAVLALLDHNELLGLMGLKILAVIIVSTIMVMSVTALTVDLCYRWMERDVAGNAMA